MAAAPSSVCQLARRARWGNRTGGQLGVGVAMAAVRVLDENLCTFQVQGGADLRVRGLPRRHKAKPGEKALLISKNVYFEEVFYVLEPGPVGLPPSANRVVF